MAEWKVRAGTCEAICCESADRRAAERCAVQIQYKTRAPTQAEATAVITAD